MPVNLWTFSDVEISRILHPVTVDGTSYAIMKSADDTPPGSYALSNGEMASMISIYSRTPDKIFPFKIADGQKAHQETPSKTVAPVQCAKELPTTACEAAKQMALAIRDGDSAKLAAYSSNGQPDLKAFWHASLGCHAECDDKQLKKLSFKAFGPASGQSFVLADNDDGMYSCSVKKTGETWEADSCDFNDGN